MKVPLLGGEPVETLIEFALFDVGWGETVSKLGSAHCTLAHSPSDEFWLELIFFAHMNTRTLTHFVGTKKMCMFHEPAGFWPNIFQ
jgi:hypothetical protein